MARARPTPDVPLARYNEKRDFTMTAEPAGALQASRPAQPLTFVVQKHWASHLHYDFRLELDGVMLSWAVPKGPTLDPAIKRMAIRVEDHPISYSSFEGEIPKGQYGGGTVIVWDNGTWVPVGDPHQGLAAGKLIFDLHGQKLAGRFELIHIAKRGDPNTQANWLLFKKRDDPWAQPSAVFDVLTAQPDSVISSPLGPADERGVDRALAATTPQPSAKRSPPRRALDATHRSAPKAARIGSAKGEDTASASPDLDLSQAKEAPLPASLAPQLATLSAAVPVSGEWLVENKFDGYRLMIRIDGDDVRLFTRNGHDWTDKLASLAIELRELGIRTGFLDGEIIVVNAAGVPEFNRLQNAIDNSRSREIDLYVFDVPYLDGWDLRRVPLITRRAILQRVMQARPNARVKYSETIDGAPADLLESACRAGLEGIMLKRADAPYVSRRADSWLKLKCHRRQEFVVVGFTDRKNASHEVGGLLLGYHDEEGRLRFGGAVGTGWNTAMGAHLHQMLVKLQVAKPALDARLIKPGRWSTRAAGTERWVKPSTVVEVEFSEWTPDGHVRHPSFKGVRTDKPASSIIREQAVVPAPSTGGRAMPSQRATSTEKRAAPSQAQREPAPAPSAAVSGVRITHAERVIDESTGLTKGELVRYYEVIAPYLLPHLKERPVSLVRAPQGIGGEHFFQKHAESTRMPSVTLLDPSLWDGHAALLAIDSADALVAAAQMNTVEFHSWNSTVARIRQPNRVVFDLDPGEGVTWAGLRDGARALREALSAIGLSSWVKTSGGKGLHVVVPIAPKLEYDLVKSWSQAVVRHLAAAAPGQFVGKSGADNRIGKIFVDYLRNGFNQTTAAAFSARARPGLGVSMPVEWEQLDDLSSASQWNIRTAADYLARRKSDPWALYAKSRQTLTRALKALDIEGPSS